MQKTEFTHNVAIEDTQFGKYDLETHIILKSNSSPYVGITSLRIAGRLVKLQSQL